MGLFSKIKQNLNHGGVDIDFQAPASVSMQDASIPVTVTLAATDQPQQINRVSVEIIQSTQSQAFNQSRDNATTTVPDKTVARVDHAQPFTLAPGQSQSLQLNLVMNAAAAIQQQLPEGSGLAQVAGAISKLQSISEAINGESYNYSLKASADVEGITFDPSKSRPIQVLKPGQIGIAINKVI
jgi:hypothetical protein